MSDITNQLDMSALLARARELKVPVRSERKLFAKVMYYIEGEYYIVDMTTDALIRQGDYQTVGIANKESVELGSWVEGYWSECGECIFVDKTYFMPKYQDRRYYAMLRPGCMARHVDLWEMCY